VAQVIEHSPNQSKALSSNPITAKNPSPVFQKRAAYKLLVVQRSW
jgi:hypothetical protein